MTPSPRNVLTPEALSMMDVIARTGSFAAAARELGKVPSALTYNVRQLEDALDVLLFDRRFRQAKLTAAGEELLNEGRRLLEQMDAVANRVKRVGTGWETQLTIAADGVLSRVTLLELCEAFFALRPPLGSASEEAGAARSGPGTRLRLRTEVLAGTWEALVTGQADLAIGVGLGTDATPRTGVQAEILGEIAFVFAVAPHHPLAIATDTGSGSGPGVITDADLLRHRAVAVADSAHRLAPLTVNLMPGQDVLTVASMGAKIEAQLRCLGCGFLPEPMIRDHIDAGRLVVRQTQRDSRPVKLGYAWRTPGPGAGAPGLALQWWLDQLRSPTTRKALVERHSGPYSDRTD